MAIATDLCNAPDANRLIHGVRVEQVKVWPDDRGFFLEVPRTGHGLPANYDLSHTQVSSALTYPGAHRKAGEEPSWPATVKAGVIRENRHPSSEITRVPANLLVPLERPLDCFHYARHQKQLR